jgi:hypothetical protein
MMGALAVDQMAAAVRRERLARGCVSWMPVHSPAGLRNVADQPSLSGACCAAATLAAAFALRLDS